MSLATPGCGFPCQFWNAVTGAGIGAIVAAKSACSQRRTSNPASARFDGMPRSAFESGAADFRLPPDQIGEEIMRLCAHPYLRQQGSGTLPVGEHLGKLNQLVKSAFGLDLSEYKLNTIERRLQRRMNRSGRVTLTRVEAHLAGAGAAESASETLVLDRVIELRPGAGC